MKSRPAPASVRGARDTGATPAQLAAGASADERLTASPAMAAQRRRIDSAFGEAAQKKEEPNRTGMPDGLKAGIESMSGVDMSDVRVRTNSAQPKQVGALAYAQGKDIHVAPGQDKHLPHEAWHIVQQRQGRVQPTTTVGNVPVNDDASLEKEADVMGERAMRKP